MEFLLLLILVFVSALMQVGEAIGAAFGSLSFPCNSLIGC